MAAPDPAHTLVPVPALLEYLGISDPGQAENQRATICLEAARSTLERMCGRQFTTTTEVRTFDVDVNTTELLVGDFQSVGEISARVRFSDNYAVLPTTAYSVRRDGPHRPYRRIRRTDGEQFAQGDDNVRINATWGMTLPPDAELPILMEAAHLFQANKSPGGLYVSHDNESVDEVRARNPAFYSVVDNWKIALLV